MRYVLGRGYLRENGKRAERDIAGTAGRAFNGEYGKYGGLYVFGKGLYADIKKQTAALRMLRSVFL